MPRMIDLDVEFISLVKRGANRLRALYKSKDGSTFEAVCLQKFDEEKGELLNVVYAPEQRDSQGDIASAEVIKRAMERAARKGGPKIDVNHDGEDVGREKAFVAQSFLVDAGDTRFKNWANDAGQPVNLAGAWATVIKIEDEELRNLARTGEIGAVSLGGTAVVVDDEEKAKSRSKGMDWDKLGQIVTEKVEAAVAKTAPEPQAKEEASTYEVDLTDPAAVEKHLQNLKLAKLADGLDMENPEDVATYLAKLKELKGEETVEAKADDDQEEVEALKAKLAKAEAKAKKLAKASRQGESTPADAGDDDQDASIKKAKASILKYTKKGRAQARRA